MSRSLKSGAGYLVAAAAAVAVAGCGGGSANDALPLIRATISVKAVSMGGTCESVPVRVTPKALAGEANKYANNKTIVTEVPTTGPTDENGAPMCNGTAETLPLAPGVWEFSAPLRSDTYKCERDIQANGDLKIVFVDGGEGCSGVVPAAEPAAEAAPAAAGEAPAGGEAPAAN
jgi:hypothetical protein